jgi:hypothetical protein
VLPRYLQQGGANFELFFIFQQEKVKQLIFLGCDKLQPDYL